MQTTINTDSINSQTAYIEYKFPIYSFTIPHFEGLNDPEPLFFYSKKDAEDFLLDLPKDWLVEMILK